MNRNKILKILADLKGEIRHKYKARIKGIFGSYARGEQKRTSDIDIRVSLRKEIKSHVLKEVVCV